LAAHPPTRRRRKRWSDSERQSSIMIFVSILKLCCIWRCSSSMTDCLLIQLHHSISADASKHSTNAYCCPVAFTQLQLDLACRKLALNANVTYIYIIMGPIFELDIHKRYGFSHICAYYTCDCPNPAVSCQIQYTLLL